MKADEIVNLLGKLGIIAGIIMLGIYVYVFVRGLKNKDDNIEHHDSLYLGIATVLIALKPILTAFLGV